jgi:hypothetical protein
VATTVVLLVQEITVRVVLPKVTVGNTPEGQKSVPVIVTWVPAALTVVV